MLLQVNNTKTTFNLTRQLQRSNRSFLNVKH